MELPKTSGKNPAAAGWPSILILIFLSVISPCAEAMTVGPCELQNELVTRTTPGKPVFLASMSTLMVSSVFYGSDSQATHWPKYILVPLNTIIPITLLPLWMAQCRPAGTEKPSHADSSFPPMSLQELNQKRSEETRKSLVALAYPFSMSAIMFALSRSESARIATGISMATPLIASLLYVNRFGDLNEDEYRRMHREIMLDLYPLWTPPSASQPSEYIGGLAISLSLP